METIGIISGIVMLVFGVLQIILFFKIWGMTNDVRKIKDRTFSSFSKEDVIKEIYKKNPNIESVLFDALYNEMKRNYYNANTWISFTDLVGQYKPLYEKAGVKIPEIFSNIHNDIDWEKTFITIERSSENSAFLLKRQIGIILSILVIYLD